MLRPLSVLKDVVLKPKSAFEEISENGKNFLIGALLIVILPSVISAFLYFDYTRLEGAVRDVAEWLISAVLLYIMGKALRGHPSFVGLLSAIGYARFPLIFPPILGYLILKSIPGDVKVLIENTKGQLSHETVMHIISHLFTPTIITLGLSILALTLWSLALCVIAVRESNKFSTWRAFCSVVVALLITTLIVTKLLKVTG